MANVAKVQLYELKSYDEIKKHFPPKNRKTHSLTELVLLMEELIRSTPEEKRNTLWKNRSFDSLSIKYTGSRDKHLRGNNVDNTKLQERYEKMIDYIDEHSNLYSPKDENKPIVKITNRDEFSVDLEEKETEN